jgi:phosphatidylglycerol:prolipoprotein diacylglycerol transferase
MYPTISLGPLVLPTAGLVYIIGAWIVLSVIERSAKAMGLNAEATYGLAAVSLVAGFVGSRLIFVISHWPAYQSNIIGIFWPLTSGYTVWAGLIFAIAAAILFGRAKQLPSGPTLDALTPGLLLTLIIISLADFLAGPGYGIQTAVPWRINVFGVGRHAVQFYEIIVAVMALIVWWAAYKKHRYDGRLFLMATAVYAGGRLFIDALRANSPLTTSGYHTIQIISLLILLICVFLLGRMVSSDEVPST